jgi:hypothetical protein
MRSEPTRVLNHNSNEILEGKLVFYGAHKELPVKN